MTPLTFLHSGTIGDAWASIPSMREYYRKSGNKIILYLEKDHPASYYEGAVHPTKNNEGDMVMLNQKMIDMMIPLFKAQSFIEDVRVWNEEKINVDLNAFRTSDVGMPALSISRWYWYLFPDFACDLSKVWLEVPDAEKDFSKGKILINRTERYTNGKLDYAFLKPFQDDCQFVGTMREYNNFTMTFDLQIQKLHVNDFLEYAQAIKQCKFYISNQSQGFQLAEGLKTPRMLEVCRDAPNVIPIGENAFDYMAQRCLEYYFHFLNKESFADYCAGVKREYVEKKEAPLRASW